MKIQTDHQNLIAPKELKDQQTNQVFFVCFCLPGEKTPAIFVKLFGEMKRRKQQSNLLSLKSL